MSMQLSKNPRDHKKNWIVANNVSINVSPVPFKRSALDAAVTGKPVGNYQKMVINDPYRDEVENNLKLYKKEQRRIARFKVVFCLAAVSLYGGSALFFSWCYGLV